MRRGARRGAATFLVFGLILAWLSVALFLLLSEWLPASAAAALVAVAVALVYALGRGWAGLRQQRRQRTAPSQNVTISPEALALMRDWVGDNPWMATGLAAGLGWATAQNDRLPLEAMEQLVELLRGIEAASGGGDGA
ncbi:hypothetical protein [uncultured Abyssibacter sp.]|uniref:hypothetical protein n=1 Tax=uncultured Abyssibacter sp. TaxID=2320202 RepID=UPI0032B13900